MPPRALISTPTVTALVWEEIKDEIHISWEHQEPGDFPTKVSPLSKSVVTFPGGDEYSFYQEWQLSDRLGNGVVERSCIIAPRTSEPFAPPCAMTVEMGEDQPRWADIVCQTKSEQGEIYAQFRNQEWRLRKDLIDSKDSKDKDNLHSVITAILVSTSLLQSPALLDSHWIKITVGLHKPSITINGKQYVPKSVTGPKGFKCILKDGRTYGSRSSRKPNTYIKAEISITREDYRVFVGWPCFAFLPTSTMTTIYRKLTVMSDPDTRKKNWVQWHEADINRGGVLIAQLRGNQWYIDEHLLGKRYKSVIAAVLGVQEQIRADHTRTAGGRHCCVSLS
ncbi:hypothetical protein C8R47DRAFT_1216240 [Mycena vitilis]|nr:hypothetical protein C8R47DRAFT_1216240 [Mycena vitilis]